MAPSASPGPLALVPPCSPLIFPCPATPFPLSLDLPFAPDAGLFPDLDSLQRGGPERDSRRWSCAAGGGGRRQRRGCQGRRRSGDAGSMWFTAIPVLRGPEQRERTGTSGCRRHSAHRCGRWGCWRRREGDRGRWRAREGARQGGCCGGRLASPARRRSYRPVSGELVLRRGQARGGRKCGVWRRWGR
jgi:hypothetical protein